MLRSIQVGDRIQIRRLALKIQQLRSAGLRRTARSGRLAKFGVDSLEALLLLSRPIDRSQPTLDSTLNRFVLCFEIVFEILKNSFRLLCSNLARGYDRSLAEPGDRILFRHARNACFNPLTNPKVRFHPLKQIVACRFIPYRRKGAIPGCINHELIIESSSFACALNCIYDVPRRA